MKKLIFFLVALSLISSATAWFDQGWVSSNTTKRQISSQNCNMFYSLSNCATCLAQPTLTHDRPCCWCNIGGFVGCDSCATCNTSPNIDYTNCPTAPHGTNQAHSSQTCSQLYGTCATCQADNSNGANSPCCWCAEGSSVGCDSCANCNSSPSNVVYQTCASSPMGGVRNHSSSICNQLYTTCSACDSNQLDARDGPCSWCDVGQGDLCYNTTYCQNKPAYEIFNSSFCSVAATIGDAKWTNSTCSKQYMNCSVCESNPLNITDGPCSWCDEGNGFHCNSKAACLLHATYIEHNGCVCGPPLGVSYSSKTCNHLYFNCTNCNMNAQWAKDCPCKWIDLGNGDECLPASLANGDEYESFNLAQCPNAAMLGDEAFTNNTCAKLFKTCNSCQIDNATNNGNCVWCDIGLGAQCTTNEACNIYPGARFYPMCSRAPLYGGFPSNLTCNQLYTNCTDCEADILVSHDGPCSWCDDGKGFECYSNATCQFNATYIDMSNCAYTRPYNQTFAGEGCNAGYQTCSSCNMNAKWEFDGPCTWCDIGWGDWCDTSDNCHSNLTRERFDLAHCNNSAVLGDETWTNSTCRKLHNTCVSCNADSTTEHGCSWCDMGTGAYCTPSFVCSIVVGSITYENCSASPLYGTSNCFSEINCTQNWINGGYEGCSSCQVNGSCGLDTSPCVYCTIGDHYSCLSASQCTSASGFHNQTCSIPSYSTCPHYNATASSRMNCSVDCNNNTVLDYCDIVDYFSPDCDSNCIPDECETFLDCNNNTINDYCDILFGVSKDCNNNTIPDECDIARGVLNDTNLDGIGDSCQVSTTPTSSPPPSTSAAPHIQKFVSGDIHPVLPGVIIGIVVVTVVLSMLACTWTSIWAADSSMSDFETRDNLREKERAHIQGEEETEPIIASDTVRQRSGWSGWSWGTRKRD